MGRCCALRGPAFGTVQLPSGLQRIENGKIKDIREYCDSALVERVPGPFPEARKLTAS
jgi:hypothetical protein